MKANLFFIFLKGLLVLSLSIAKVQGQNLISKGDSLFAAQRFSESKLYYEKAYFSQKKTTAAALLKLSFIEGSMDNYVMSIFYLHQYYLFNPSRKVKAKIEEMANQKKLNGYSIDEADYAFFLYRAYSSYVEGGFLLIGFLLFLFLLNRKRKNISLGYTPIFTLIFLLIGAYFYNFRVPYKRAILAKDKVFLMSGPSAGSSVLDVLAQGHRLEWTGESDIWFEVKWNEKKGWIKKTELLFFL